MLELLPLVGIALLFWLFIIRPARRRQMELSRMQSSLGLGDEVVLTSGIFGVVAGLEDDQVQLIVAEGVTVRVARGAVGSVVTPVERPEQPTNEDQSGSDAGPEEN
ncbi:MAG: preprotein translocase subunit YajC [Nocardioides sp.]